jgi:hypothetical protein
MWIRARTRGACRPRRPGQPPAGRPQGRLSAFFAASIASPAGIWARKGGRRPADLTGLRAAPILPALQGKEPSGKKAVDFSPRRRLSSPSAFSLREEAHVFCAL